jgi:hypothetical protein
MFMSGPRYTPVHAEQTRVVYVDLGRRRCQPGRVRRHRRLARFLRPLRPTDDDHGDDAGRNGDRDRRHRDRRERHPDRRHFLHQCPDAVSLSHADPGPHRTSP